MGDFAIPSFDFGGVGDDLDFSLSDVRRGGKSDGIETCRYDRSRIYDNVLDEVEYEHAQDFVDDFVWAGTSRSSRFDDMDGGAACASGPTRM